MNNIEIALIAPGSMVTKYCSLRPCQMMLAGCLLDPGQTQYQDHYFNAAAGSFTMLDNGAWESESVSPETLILLADKFHASEMIAPDVINDPVETLKRVEHFLDVWSVNHLRTRPLFNPSIAAVVHGRTLGEACNFVRQIAALNEKRPAHRIGTLAIGRAFTRSTGDCYDRYRLASWIHECYGRRFHIHLLGYNDDWGRGELKSCQALVRSVDTAAPFSAALASRSMSDPGVPRQETYFSTPSSSFDAALVRQNIDTLDSWAGYR
jgi:hypothetical protein